MITNPFTQQTLNWTDHARQKAKEAIKRKAAMRNRTSGQKAPYRPGPLGERAEGLEIVKKLSSSKLFETQKRRAGRAAQAESIRERLEGARSGLVKQGSPDAETISLLDRKLTQAERLARRAKDRAEGLSSFMVKNSLLRKAVGEALKSRTATFTGGALTGGAIVGAFDRKKKRKKTA